jgi:hypothetical protein
MAEATDRLVDVVRRFGEDRTRDVWTFDRAGRRRLFARPDVADANDDDAAAMARAVDDERYGFVTRNTFEALYDDPYAFTVRGFEAFDLFRTFLGAPGGPPDVDATVRPPVEVGLVARFDASSRDPDPDPDVDDGSDPVDYRALDAALRAVVDDVGAAAVAPTDAHE